MKGGSVILETDAKLRRDVLMLWVREATVIAEINGGTRKVSIYDDVLNKKLRGRLKLDSQTGSLTIRDFTTEHAGLYTLKMMRGQSVSFKSFTVNLCDTMESVSVMKGDSFTLRSGLTAIQEDDVIQCLYGDKGNPIARINGWARESPTYYNEDRFTGRLDMTSETASLTITDSETTDSGVYELHIFTPEKKIARSFSVTVSDPTTDASLLI
uniref:Immunoglobulin V-set domain-containing protein n=2 Tax=Sinocyclocheilus rhinocerous TaxID=307959 RepID=A0A673JFM1_9TELE